MSGESQRALWKRRRVWLGLVLAAWFALSVYGLLPHIGVGQGITNANGRRIVPGMARAEVEAILGVPNPLPNLARKGEAFWDENTLLGFRYVNIHVVYDAEGRV